MLRISNAEKHHFMFSPIHAETEATRHKEPRRDKFLSNRTLFVPELVKIHPIPASVWREIQMVPFVLNRLFSFIKIHHFMEGGLMEELNPSMYTLEKPRKLAFSPIKKPEIPFDRLILRQHYHRFLDIHANNPVDRVRCLSKLPHLEPVKTILGATYL